MPHVIFELALIVSISAVLGIAAKLLKQPTVLAYLAAGALIAYFNISGLADHETFNIFSELGIVFLLFLVGLEINYASLRLVGASAAILGIGQVFFTSLAGFFVVYALGFPPVEALYIAVALAFSSTIIIVKLLSDKKDLNSLYGKLSIGLLLVQDIVAVLLIVFLSGVEAGQQISAIPIGATLLKAIALFTAMFWLGRKIMPRLFDLIARSQELLFLTSLAWLFAVAMLVSKLGFSLEIAGFLAGLALANSSEHYQIASKIRPLRDFFILIFFAVLGSSIVGSDFSGVALPTILLSLFVLIGNPLIVLVLMGAMGFRKRTSFLAGVTVAQVSEFSLILAALGLKIGHIGEPVVALITAVAVVTMTVSTYLILHADKLFRHLAALLTLFERSGTEDPAIVDATLAKPIVLIGFNRIGHSIAENLKKKDLLIIDFDPDVINHIKHHQYTYLFGDIADEDILEEAQMDKARLVISTSPDLSDNLTLLSYLMRLPKKPASIFRAETEADAKLLYRAGADYVLIPNISSGAYLGKILALDPRLRALSLLKNSDLSDTFEELVGNK